MSSALVSVVRAEFLRARNLDYVRAARALGLEEGDAHVIRNAGGRASEDAIRSLVISYKLLGTREWFVVHHTAGSNTYSAADVLRLTRAGQKAALMGLEGGHALQASEDVLERLADAGIRYVTLTHSNTNGWADSSGDAPRWNGLNQKGRDLVRAMNRLGVLVDLSHVSDSTFYDALAVSEAPVILSHSSARALNPHARNVTDAMLRALADNGGVIMINFYSRYIAQRGNPATLRDILDHIDHAVEVAGIDHVGLGSDFDGVPFLPRGMEDATRLPHITYGLLKRGYSEEDVRKILGGNTLRVLADAERVAERLRGEG